MEREQKTLAPLLLSCLSPGQIVFGKLLGASAYVALILSTSLPLWMAVLLLGGVGLGGVVLQYMSLLVTTVLLAALGLRVSASFRRSMYAIALVYLLLFLVFTIAIYTYGYLQLIESQLQLEFLHYLAFLSPVFHLDPRTAGQWPAFVITYGLLSYLLFRSAVRRLGQEGRSQLTF